MNIDPECVARAVTKRTKVIVPMHYAGVCCDMNELQAIAKDNGLFIVEDAAQAVDSTYFGKAAGALSDIGCYSFHETKNFSMGEGGAAMMRNETLIERAEIVREKGTDRSRFFRGQVDKYSWVDIGSSILPSELNAAYLLPQLENHEAITAWRLSRWTQYDDGLKDLREQGRIKLPYISEGCRHNAHMYYIKCGAEPERAALINFLKERGIMAVFHYIPLHSSLAGRKFGRFYGEDLHTTLESERLLRLPMYYGLTQTDCDTVIQTIHDFYRN
jgi:dTDP-4-amino-4,6-dideoxygalactose transaminase